MIPLRDENPTGRTAVVTILLMAACVAVFLLVQSRPATDAVVPTPDGEATVSGDIRLELEWAAIPCEIVQQRPLTLAEAVDTYARGDVTACDPDTDDPPLFPDKAEWVAVLVSMFLHGGVVHLTSNMLFLWIFGNNVEDHMGPYRFMALYLVGGIAATAAHVAVQPDSTVPVVGASGAIAAVMGAYLVWFPRAPIRTLILIPPVVLLRDLTAKWLLGGWFVLQFFTGSGSGVAWVAHVGGFVLGAAVGLAVRRSPPIRRLLWRPRPWPTPGWDPTGGVGRGPLPHLRRDPTDDDPPNWFRRR